MRFTITNEPVKPSSQLEVPAPGFVVAYNDENKMVGIAILDDANGWTLHGSSYMCDVLGETEDLKELMEMFPDYTFKFIEWNS
jgi:fumarylacetoacetate (FAA) hydrolase family protein